MGVFEEGQYLVAKSKFPGLEQIPQMKDHAGLTRGLCGIKGMNGIVVLDPSGAVVKAAALAEYPVSTQLFDDLFLDHKSTINESYAAFAALPEQFGQLGWLLRHGQYAQAFRMVRPFIDKGSEPQKLAARLTMVRINAYQAGVLKAIDENTKAGRADEAYRLANQALEDHQNIDCEFTDSLKAIITGLRKETAVKNLEQARKVYEAAFKFYAAGKDDTARQYLSKVAGTFPDSFYGRLAARLLKAG